MHYEKQPDKILPESMGDTILASLQVMLNKQILFI